MKDSYNYVFHYNDYVSGPDRWHCFHRDAFVSYWSGSSNKTGSVCSRVTSGASPAKAWKKMIKLNEQTA